MHVHVIVSTQLINWSQYFTRRPRVIVMALT
jgi:hypothetical protein